MQEDVRELGARGRRGAIDESVRICTLAANEVREQRERGEDEKDIRGDVDGAGLFAKEEGVEQRDEGDGAPESQDVHGGRLWLHVLKDLVFYTQIAVGRVPRF